MPSLPWTLVKAFVKLQCDIVDRFETSQELLLYVCLLCLMDREGRIRMDVATLATKIRWKRETLEDTLELLMRPNPKSKCKKFEGACVASIDPDSPHLGFVIPAAIAHRKNNANTEARRTYRAKKLREYRASLRAQGLSARKRPLKVREQREALREQREALHELPPPSKTEVCEHREANVKHRVNCDRDRDRDKEYVKESSGLSLPPPTPSRDLQDPDLIFSVDEILELLCEKVYASKLRKNQIGQETVRRVSEMLPFSREQIELVGDYYNLPPDDCWPELKKRRSLGIDMLVRYWADQVSVAVMFDQKYFAR